MSHLLPYGGTLPTVDAAAWVAPNAALIGDVVVGPESSIWFSATLRGDVMPIRVGARTSIQDGSVLHATDGWAPTLIGDDVTVGHAVVLHGCTVRDRVLVGMGSVVLDGAELESDVILGAGSLVTQRTRIPSGVLAMGRPAKPVRELTEKERLAIRQAAASYVKKTADYRLGR